MVRKGRNIFLSSVTVAPENGNTDFWGTKASEMQSGVTVSGNSITGTLKYLDEGTLASDWGPGNFLALKFTASDWGDYTSVKVGLTPSEGSGLAELITDPDKNGVFKITNRNLQKLVVVLTDGTHTKTQTYDLSGLAVEGAS